MPIVTGATTSFHTLAMPNKKPDIYSRPMLKELRTHVLSTDTTSFLARLLAEYQAVAKEMENLEEETRDVELDDLI